MTMEVFGEFDNLVAFGNTSEELHLLSDNSTCPLVLVVQAITLYIIPVICGVGLIGGVCSCLVFTFSTFQYQPCSHYLAVLTAADTGFLIALLIAWLTTLHPIVAETPGLCQVIVYMTYTCSFLSAWYLVLLMIERYITVWYPLMAPVLCIKRNARLAIGVITLLGSLLYLHSFFTTEFVLGSMESPCKQKDRFMPFLTVFTYLDFVVTFILPFSIIFVLNVRIILAVRSFRRRNQAFGPSPRLVVHGRQRGGVQCCLMSLAQVHATILLVGVASVFLVLYLPSHALRLYLLIRVSTQRPVYSQQLMLAQQICQFIYYFNFAVDFFVFSINSKRFRSTILRFLKKL